MLLPYLLPIAQIVSQLQQQQQQKTTTKQQYKQIVIKN